MLASDVFTAGNAVVAASLVLVTVVFGYPQWRLARRSEQVAHTQELAENVAEFLGLPPKGASGTRPGPDSEHPSVIDLLSKISETQDEIRDLTSEQAALSLIVAYHMEDRHGAPIPERTLENAPPPLRKKHK